MTVEDGESARLTLSREVGMPEPVLYEDESPTIGIEDDEKDLNDLIELQDRMGNGIKMINQINQYITEQFRSNPYMGAIYWAWDTKSPKCAYKQIDNLQYLELFAVGDQKKDIRREINRLKDKRYMLLTHLKNKPQVNALERRSNLWKHWWKLKGQCDAITKDKGKVWVEYFNLEKASVNPYLTNNREVEDQSIDSRMMSSDIAYRESHIEQEQLVLI